MTMRLTPAVALCLSLLAAAPLCAQEESALPPEAAPILQLMASNRAPALEARRPFDSWFPPGARLTAMERDDNGVTLVFDIPLGQRPWLRKDADAFLAALRNALGDSIGSNDELRVMIDYGRRSLGRVPFEEHITSPDSLKARQEERKAPPPKITAPILQHTDYPGPKRQFEGRNVVVSASHGLTWHNENRWQYQRARLFTTIEDLYVLSIVHPFLAPMFEQAGMNVWAIRERDWQHAEVIVDNDGADGESQFELSGQWERAALPGWRGGLSPAMLPGDEPFREGTTLVSSTPGSTATFIPEIPHEGRYAVYLSWAADDSHTDKALVTINHAGGSTNVRVNQQAAGGTWVLAGFYRFPQGVDRDKASVTFTHDGDEGNRVSVDAVRFGGGMGNAAPGSRVSGYPRWGEAAHYWLQHSGAPHGDVVGLPMGPNRFGPDYNRDIIAKAEWPNYLQGAPGGPNPRRNMRGLGVPVDLMINWHTDAGISSTGLIGSLSIYKVLDQEGNGTFPDGRTRWLNRDLAGLVHTEILHTLRGNWSSTWASRALMEGDYGEARRPNVPVVLLETLSHQNFHDMKYGLDPRFKRDLARAVYKGSLRFIAWSLGEEPIFTPLAPEGVSARSLGGGSVVLEWIPREDPLEPTAKPDGFIVYKSTDGFAFDNGVYTEDSTLQLSGIAPDVPHYFRVTAANAGGESFPSPVVGVRWSPDRESILVVDGFDRISAPAAVQTELARGFDRSTDPGVGYEATYGLVGEQYDFDVTSDWQNDLETPGYGASRNEWEKRLEPGNTFNHIAAQGAVLHELNVPFDSVTIKGAELASLSNYPLVSWIAGRQRTVMPPEGITTTGVPDRMKPEFEIMTNSTRRAVANYLDRGGRLLITGAHVGEEMLEGPLANADTRAFANNTLGIRTASRQATRINAASGKINSGTPFDQVPAFRFGRDLEPPINILPTVYGVPSAEGFSPSEDAKVVLQYGDSRLPAAVATDKSLLIGFPLETVMPPARRTELLRAAIETLHPDAIATQEPSEQENPVPSE
jgi:hypothetical protein